MGRVTTNDMATHVDELCGQHHITPEWIGRTKRAWAVKRRRTVRIYPIINQKRYATALHEIGHVVGPRQGGRRIEQEWGAWEFAIGHALTDFTPATYRMILRYLTGYVSRYRRWRRAYLPPLDDPFWRFLDDIRASAQG